MKSKNFGTLGLGLLLLAAAPVSAGDSALELSCRLMVESEKLHEADAIQGMPGASPQQLQQIAYARAEQLARFYKETIPEVMKARFRSFGAEKSRITAELEAMTRESSALQAKRDQLTREDSALRHSVNHLNMRLSQIESKMSNIRKEYQGVSNSRLLNERFERLEMAKAEAVPLERELASTKRRLHKTEKELAEIEPRARAASAAIELARSKFNQLVSSNRDLIVPSKLDVLRSALAGEVISAYERREIIRAQSTGNGNGNSYQCVLDPSQAVRSSAADIHTSTRYKKFSRDGVYSGYVNSNCSFGNQPYSTLDLIPEEHRLESCSRASTEGTPAARYFPAIESCATLDLATGQFSLRWGWVKEWTVPSTTLDFIEARVGKDCAPFVKPAASSLAQSQSDSPEAKSTPAGADTVQTAAVAGQSRL